MKTNVNDSQITIRTTANLAMRWSGQFGEISKLIQSGKACLVIGGKTIPMHSTANLLGTTPGRSLALAVTTYMREYHGLIEHAAKNPRTIKNLAITSRDGETRIELNALQIVYDPISTKQAAKDLELNPDESRMLNRLHEEMLEGNIEVSNYWPSMTKTEFGWQVNHDITSGLSFRATNRQGMNFLKDLEELGKASVHGEVIGTDGNPLMGVQIYRNDNKLGKPFLKAAANLVQVTLVKGIDEAHTKALITSGNNYKEGKITMLIEYLDPV